MITPVLVIVRAEIGQSLCSGTQERTLQFATQRLSTLFGGAYILARASWLKRGLPWRSLASSETSMRLTGMFQPFTWMENDISVAADFRHLKPLPGGQVRRTKPSSFAKQYQVLIPSADLSVGSA